MPTRGMLTPTMLTQTLRTGTPGVICTTNTGPSEYTDSPVASAKAAREQAEETERTVMQQQDQADSLQTAKDASQEAKARSKSAFKEKPNTAAGKQAHQTAAMAHQDAAKAYTVCAGANSGNELDVRATAKKKADQHTDMAKKHAAIGEGNTMLARTMNTGCKMVVVNVWSDEARQASAEARAATTKAGPVEGMKTPKMSPSGSNLGADHEAMARYHGKANDKLAASDGTAARAHSDAWAAHNKAAVAYGGQAQK